MFWQTHVFSCFFLPQHAIQGPNEHWHADQHHWHADQHLSNGAYGCCYLRRSGLLHGRYAPHVYITQATRSEQVHRQIKTYLTPPALNFFLEDVYGAMSCLIEYDEFEKSWPLNFKHFLQVHLRWSTPPRPT